jgi:hypothetical protein
VDRKPYIAKKINPNLTDSPMCGSHGRGLGNRRERGNGLGHDGSAGHVDLGLHLADGANLVGAVARDVAGLTALVASLAGDRGVGAVASQVANRIAVVAPVAGAGAAQAEGRALGLDVSETLAVVALLRLSGAGHGALVRLVVWLLAVVAEPMRRGAGLGMVAKLTTLVARPTRN